ncbi:MAG TPA: hypothetical protein VEC56_10715 [Candidatus Krumholzibacteria bacterium]|nr:hypothetical protein [Candidatus Krumholzibacteria bacterium]
MPKFAFMLAVVLTAVILVPSAGRAQTGDLPAYLEDRGTGQPTSMFGTYIKKGELLVYPFFEYYHDDDAEYTPDELGYGLDMDFRGKYRAEEYLIFLAYGITDWLALEFEMAVYIGAELETSPDDPTAVPGEIEESGTGDVEGQIRARLARETDSRPEFFSYLEIVTPQQKDKVLIGTPDWEYKLGFGAVRGFSFGTMTVRLAAEYSMEESATEFGEYALEYLNRLSPSWRIYLGIEGSQDEVELIPEAQWHIKTDTIVVKLNSAFGLTSKAADWAPEVGIVFSF